MSSQHSGDGDERAIQENSGQMEVPEGSNSGSDPRIDIYPRQRALS